MIQLPLLTSLTPIYLFANIHCFGMCGPLMLLMAKQKGRAAYLLGRLLSYAAVGALAGALGQLPLFPLSPPHALLTVKTILILWATKKLIALLSATTAISSIQTIQKFLQKAAQMTRKTFMRPIEKIPALLIDLSSRNFRLAFFCMGLLSVLIPCGQTILVFSLCALHQSPLSGLIAGALLALISTPALAAPLGLLKIRFQTKNKLLEELIALSSLILAIILF